MEEVKTFKIEIKEYLSKIIEVKAYNIKEAIEKAKQAYEKEEIILDDNNYIDTEIEEYLK